MGRERARRPTEAISSYMCGIAGIFSSRPGADVSACLEDLTHHLAHRGPDGVGYRYFQGRAWGLGHRRLSIVDLETGAQPMANEDETVWIVFNGELYNHLDLRHELEARGHRFRTQSDTEAIVHGWEEWGVDVLPRMNGIYAFALFDCRTRDLWIARDPAGVKPVYLGVTDGTWWLASELLAARRAGLVTGPIRRSALAEFLVYRFIPSPGTPFQRAWKVPPGHLCRINLVEPPTEPCFRPFGFTAPSLPSSLGPQGWSEAIRDGLGRAVARQLMADVPIGVLLSGGVDSTVVTRLMLGAGGPKPAGFAIGFSDVPDGGELPVARRAARALEVPLTEVAVAQEAFLEAWPAQVAALGEPIANSGVLLVGLLCRAVCRTHKVVLTGQGADEPLGGYPRHTAERFYPLAARLQRLLAVLPPGLTNGDQVRRMQRIAGTPSEATRFSEILAVFSPAEAASWCDDSIDAESLSEPVATWLGAVQADDSVNRLLAVDARLSLADDLLLVADHTAMASSVELRVPFLDLELLAMIERMPSKYKVSLLGERKWLYRRAVRDLLPPPLRPRLTGWRARTGRKMGFTTPLERWYRQWVGREAEAYLRGAGSCLPAYLHDPPMRAFLSRAARDPQRHQRQLLALYVLETWLRALDHAPARDT